MSLLLGNRRHRGLLLAAVLVFGGLFGVPAASKSETLDDLHPGLSLGLIRNARLGDLEKGVVCTAGDKRVTGEALNAAVDEESGALSEQLGKNLLFMLDQHLMRLLLQEEAKKEGIPETLSEDEAIGKLLNKQAGKVSVDDSELPPAYEAIRETLGGVPFEQVKEALRDYLLKEKQSQAVGEYLAGLGSDIDITLDKQWTEKQAEIMLDNPVDRARASGIPTLVEFGAAGCGPCDMMQPILEKLRKKYGGKLNVVFIHVGEEQVLGARYGISSIPVQAFFDASGTEVTRHVGFYPEAEVEKILAEMGVNS
ncbi:MAG TPA: thioredoxin [Desulfobacteraceae bacterium]|nr:thioredoxin [Desulfobacteraceae bacterium]